MTGTFEPTTSSNTIWFDESMEDCLTSHIEGIEDDVAALETGKANLVHTHSTYADLDHEHNEYAAIAHTHSEYADSDHTHTEFATATHNHSQYALATDVDALEAKVGDTTVASQISSAIASKANIDHTHTEYASVAHTHTDYAATSHSHSEYASVGHIHSYNDLEDKPTIPTSLPANGGDADTVDGKHASEFATATDLTALQTLVGDSSVSSQITAALENIDVDLTGYATESYVTSQVATKVDQVDGKELSSNDFTDAEKTKLSGIETGANKYILPTATSSVLGGVKIGSNITNSSGVINLTSGNVTSALGYTPFNSGNIIPKSKGGTGADLSDIPANAIIRNSSSGGSDLYYTATKNGACYATSTNGSPTFGTLPVAQGGTGKTVAWTNGTVSSMNNTTITSAQFAVFPYLNKAFIRLNVLLGSALAAGSAAYIAMPSTVSTAHTALSCYNHSSYDIHCGMSSDSGIYVINCGTSNMPASVRLYISGWYSI